MGTGGDELTTELDSHANMVVVGKHATVILLELARVVRYKHLVMNVALCSGYQLWMRR